MRKKLLKNLQKELKSRADKRYKKGAKNFFKETIKIYGVRLPEVRRISRKYFLFLKGADKKEVFKICEELLKTGYNENIHIALAWADRFKKEFEKSDFRIFESWFKKSISNWATCDDFCGHVFGYLIWRFPDLAARVKKWTGSKNRWLRRAAAVVLIYSVRKGKHLKHALETADLLLEDSDDLVQKGYGWMLKEASVLYQKQVFDFIMKRRHKMPRTALRYAIEKMPNDLRKKAMSN